MTFRRIAAVMVCAAGVSSAAQSSTVENQRLCKDQDLQGTWKMVSMRENPKDGETQFYKDMPYQYVAFLPQRRYSYVISNREIAQPQRLSQFLGTAHEGKRVLEYTLDDKGGLDLYTDKKVTQRYRCLAIKNAQGQYAKGDLVLTGYTIYKTELSKLYRRWF